MNGDRHSQPAEQKPVGRWTGRFIGVFFLVYVSSVLVWILVMLALDKVAESLPQVFSVPARRLLASAGIFVVMLLGLVFAIWDNSRIRAKWNAALIATTLIQLRQSSSQIRDQLPRLFASVSSELLRAENEYEQNAFGPFWDAIERAVAGMSSSNSCLRTVQQNAERYQAAAGQASFPVPPFPVPETSLPDVKATAEHFHRVVRKAQTNFQFATIWEQRKTRQVLIAGFRTLGEAVENMALNLQTSVSELQQSLREIRQEQAKQTDLVDNIWRKRRPPF